MKKLPLLIVFLFFALSNQQILAQTDTTDVDIEIEDEFEDELEDLEEDEDFEIEFDDEDNILDWGKKSPSIEVDYIKNNFHITTLSSEELFVPTNTMRIKLGYSYKSEKSIANKHFEKFLVLGLADERMNKNYDLAPILPEVWSAGFISRTAYSYGNENIAIMPYYGSGAGFYTFKNKANYAVPFSGLSDFNAISRYADEDFHYMHDYESGLRLLLGETVGIKAGYSFNVHYPRFMTWQYLGSVLVYSAGYLSLEKFDKWAISNSPILGSIFDAVLMSGYNYLFYSFQKEKMNWPFETEAPLTNEGLTFGLSIKF